LDTLNTPRTLLFLAITVACQPENTEHIAPQIAVTADPAPVQSPSIDRYALRVNLDELTRIDIDGPRAKASFARSGSSWIIVDPIEFPTNPTAMDSILGVLGGLEIISSQKSTQSQMDSRGFGDKSAITVTAWSADTVSSKFRVGYGTAQETYAVAHHQSNILAIRGRFRQILDRPLDEFRLSTITDIDTKSVAKVVYQNRHGTLILTANPQGSGEFRIPGSRESSFDDTRAAQNASILTHLLAKGFADLPIPTTTELFDNTTPRATLHWIDGNRSRTTDIWIGGKTSDNRLYLRTSQSDQVYMVSANLESALVPRVSDFQLSQPAHNHSDTEEPTKHVHGEPPTHTLTVGETVVPDALMLDLRKIARDQAISPE